MDCDKYGRGTVVRAAIPHSFRHPNGNSKAQVTSPSEFVPDRYAQDCQREKRARRPKKNVPERASRGWPA